jgi:hypothetical protein
MISIFNRHEGKRPKEIVLYVEESAEEQKAAQQKTSNPLAAFIAKLLPLKPSLD